MISWARPFHVGGEYLLFPRVLDNGRVSVTWTGAYERAPGGTFRSLMRGIGFLQSDEPAEAVLERLRQIGR